MDSSGIQFFYTKQKPVHEAGGISVAQPIIPLMIIPPNADRFMHSATCLPSCTDQVSAKTLCKINSTKHVDYMMMQKYIQTNMYSLLHNYNLYTLPQYFPDDGITVFATFLHTHLIG